MKHDNNVQPLICEKLVLNWGHEERVRLQETSSSTWWEWSSAEPRPSRRRFVVKAAPPVRRRFTFKAFSVSKSSRRKSWKGDVCFVLLFFPAWEGHRASDQPRLAAINNSSRILHPPLHERRHIRARTTSICALYDAPVHLMWLLLIEWGLDGEAASTASQQQFVRTAEVRRRGSVTRTSLRRFPSGFDSCDARRWQKETENRRNPGRGFASSDQKLQRMYF